MNFTKVGKEEIRMQVRLDGMEEQEAIGSNESIIDIKGEDDKI